MKKIQSNYLLVVCLIVTAGVPGMLANAVPSCSARNNPPNSERIESFFSFGNLQQHSLPPNLSTLDAQPARSLSAASSLSEPDDEDSPEDSNESVEKVTF
jgi:hypothetical protein